MARPPIQSNVTESELIELKLITRSTKVESRLKERAFLILDWHEGKTYDVSQSLHKVSRSVVAKWRNRFYKYRIAGLSDAPRSGKPVIITEAQKNNVLQLACSKPDKGYTNWSQQRIGLNVGISQSKVHKILKEHDLKPHKVEYYVSLQ